MSTYLKKLHHLVREALNEDIGDGDHSTLSSIPFGEKGKAVLKIKQAGILAGVAVAEVVFKMTEATVVFTAFMKDGDAMVAGDKAFEVDASVHTILTCERLVLNIMQRMSGIATLTKQYTEKLGGYHTQILDTRRLRPIFACLKKSSAHRRRHQPSVCFVRYDHAKRQPHRLCRRY